MTAVLVDAGPLVALIDRSDRNHESCKATLQSVTDPLASVWPVVTEAMYLLAFSWRAQDALWDLIASQALALLPLDAGDAPRIRDLMHKYRDLPMDLADAALVRVAERERLRRVFTLDRRHFALYRPLRLGRFVILP
ncbi:MAG TPA: PIN domain-containing protein [Gemmatimonadales bacterium]|nr:PIN domain-containing protein [Gemmatimonadales bacterium]